MNKKLYFNDKYIEFIGPEAQFADNQSFETYSAQSGKPRNLKAALDSFLNAQNPKNLRWIGTDFAGALKLLAGHFYFIEAAGGMIEKDGKFLFIRRHNRWDLPKGKLEKKEGVEAAALRECEEECGIRELRIVKRLSPTYHIYPYKDGFALKQSHWFYMKTAYNGQLFPQIEEDITEVRWFNREDIPGIVLTDTYYTIADVVKEGLAG